MSNQLNLPGIDTPLVITHDLSTLVNEAIQKGKETFTGKPITVDVEMTPEMKLVITVQPNEPEPKL